MRKEAVTAASGRHKEKEKAEDRKRGRKKRGLVAKLMESPEQKSRDKDGG